MSHTPGPWTVKGNRVVSAPHSGENFGSGGSFVAVLVGNESDAALIAAAPRMYEILSALRDGTPGDDRPYMDARALLGELDKGGLA